jgi:hypothetical protein
MNKEIQLNYKLVRTDSINVDARYQRNVSIPKVKKIMKTFDMNLFGMLLISKRSNGEYYLIDGQHRHSAAKRLSIKFVPCNIMDGLTVEKEAAFFVELNTNRFQTNSIDRMKAKLISGDEDAKRIQDILLDNGIYLNLTKKGGKTTRRKGFINSVGCLERIYKSKGGIHLDLVFRIICSIWKNSESNFDPESLSTDTISGMSYFLSKTDKQIDMKKLITKLKKKSANDMLREQRRNQSIYGKNKPSNYAKAILEVYNYRSTDKVNITL